MDLDEMVDSLAFGATTPKVSSCLGLYLSPETIYIAETKLEKGRVAVEHLVRIPVPAPEKADKKAEGSAPPSTAATLTTDFLVDNAKLAAVMRQSMSQIRWGTRDVMVTLSHHLGLLRYYTMPAIERQYWKSAVPLEAKKYIPIPFDVLSHDYQVIPLPPDANNKPRQGTLIAVTQKKNLPNIQTLLEELDLKLIGMEVAPCSVMRLWESIEQTPAGKPFCQVHFDGGNIRILVADRGLPVFFRELFLGADSSLADQRKIDLGGCLSFAQKQLAVGGMAQVRVSGSTQLLPKWQEVFSQETGVTASAQDTAGLLGIKSGDWGGYAAIGASARFTRPGGANLDLGRIGRVTEEERRTAKDIMGLAGALALVLAGVGLARNAVYQVQARELSKYKREPDIEAIFAGKDSAAIEDMLRRMQVQLDTVGNMGGDSRKVLDVLRDVVDCLPERTWLTKINLTNPLLKGASQAEMQLLGHAVAPSLGQEQDLAYQFRDRLIKSPIVGKMFSDIQVSVSGRDLPADATRGLDPAALQRKLEQRTTFTLSARSRK